MSAELNGRAIAILATDGVEEVELTSPMEALRAAGATVTVVSPGSGPLQALNNDVAPRREIALALAHARAAPGEFDGILLPGGTTNPDKLRTDERAVRFVRHFVDSDKPIAAICHGAWTLINADGVRNHRLTSWPSLRQDLRNAGAEWVDEPCVVSGKLVTSRNPGDLPAFNAAITTLFAA